MITARRLGFSEPADYHSSIPFHPPRFPRRAEDVGKPTLVLDMDETLLHSEEIKSPLHSDDGNHTVRPTDFLVRFSDGTGVIVSPRPFLMEFLLLCKQRFELVVFTAGSEEYANLVLDQLDPTRTLFAHRLFRQHCLYVPSSPLGGGAGGFVKDLSILQRDLRRTICVDNMIHFVMQMENGIPIPSYFQHNAQDFALRNVLVLLLRLCDSHDVREDLARMFGGGGGSSSPAATGCTVA